VRKLNQSVLELSNENQGQRREEKRKRKRKRRAKGPYKGVWALGAKGGALAPGTDGRAEVPDTTPLLQRRGPGQVIAYMLLQ